MAITVSFMSLALSLASIASADVRPLRFGNAVEMPHQLVTYRMDASWAVAYRTVPTLRAASDVAVAGSIGGVVKVTAGTPRNPPFTDYALVISAVLWDPGHHLAVGQAITVHQTGAIVGSARFEIGDDPLFRPGEQVVLFLHQFAEGQYYVVGGPTGRFRMSGGLVHPVAHDGIKMLAGTTKDEFFAMVRK
jgi:hypothetical protein